MESKHPSAAPAALPAATPGTVVALAARGPLGAGRPRPSGADSHADGKRGHSDPEPLPRVTFTTNTLLSHTDMKLLNVHHPTFSVVSSPTSIVRQPALWWTTLDICAFELCRRAGIATVERVVYSIGVSPQLLTDWYAGRGVHEARYAALPSARDNEHKVPTHPSCDCKTIAGCPHVDGCACAVVLNPITFTQADAEELVRRTSEHEFYLAVVAVREDDTTNGFLLAGTVAWEINPASNPPSFRLRVGDENQDEWALPTWIRAGSTSAVTGYAIEWNRWSSHGGHDFYVFRPAYRERQPKTAPSLVAALASTGTYGSIDLRGTRVFGPATLGQTHTEHLEVDSLYSFGQFLIATAPRTVPIVVPKALVGELTTHALGTLRTPTAWRDFISVARNLSSNYNIPVGTTSEVALAAASIAFTRNLDLEISTVSALTNRWSRKFTQHARLMAFDNPVFRLAWITALIAVSLITSLLWKWVFPPVKPLHVRIIEQLFGTLAFSVACTFGGIALVALLLGIAVRVGANRAVVTAICVLLTLVIEGSVDFLAYKADPDVRRWLLTVIVAPLTEELLRRPTGRWYTTAVVIIESAAKTPTSCVLGSAMHIACGELALPVAWLVHILFNIAAWQFAPASLWSWLYPEPLPWYNRISTMHVLLVALAIGGVLLIIAVTRDARAAWYVRFVLYLISYAAISLSAKFPGGDRALYGGTAFESFRCSEIGDMLGLCERPDYATYIMMLALASTATMLVWATVQMTEITFAPLRTDNAQRARPVGVYDAAPQASTTSNAPLVPVQPTANVKPGPDKGREKDVTEEKLHLAGLGVDGEIPALAANNHHNMLVSIKNRAVARVSENPLVVARLLWWVHNNFELLFPGYKERFANFKPMSDDEFFRKYGGNQAVELRKAREAIREMHIVDRRIHKKGGFLKQEKHHMGKDGHDEGRGLRGPAGQPDPGAPPTDMKPRHIATMDDTMKVAVGPTIIAAQKQIAAMWNQYHPFFYTCGASGEQVGAWKDRAEAEAPACESQPIVNQEVDISIYDGSVLTAKTAVEGYIWYRLGADEWATPLGLSVFKLLMSQTNVSIKSTFKDVYYVVATRKSGDFNTSVGNTVISGLCDLFMWCESTGATIQQVISYCQRSDGKSGGERPVAQGQAVYYRSVGMGDDKWTIRNKLKFWYRPVYPPMRENKEGKNDGLWEVDDVDYVRPYNLKRARWLCSLIFKMTTLKGLAAVSGYKEVIETMLSVGEKFENIPFEEVPGDYDPVLLHALLGFKAKLKIYPANEPWMSEYCSGLWWPTADGTVLGPKIGRQLYKQGWTDKPVKFDLGWLRANMLGLANTWGHIPILHEFWAAQQRLIDIEEAAARETKAAGGSDRRVFEYKQTRTEVAELEYKHPAARGHNGNRLTELFFRKRYGYDAAEARHQVQQLLTLAELGQVLSHPILTAIVERDTE